MDMMPPRFYHSYHGPVVYTGIDSFTSLTQYRMWYFWLINEKGSYKSVNEKKDSLAIICVMPCDYYVFSMHTSGYGG